MPGGQGRGSILAKTSPVAIDGGIQRERTTEPAEKRQTSRIVLPQFQLRTDEGLRRFGYSLGVA
jgi:hypothetical protein